MGFEAWALGCISTVWGMGLKIPREGSQLLKVTAVWTPTMRTNNGPKLENRAQKVFIVHTFRVQVVQLNLPFKSGLKEPGLSWLLSAAALMLSWRMAGSDRSSSRLGLSAPLQSLPGLGESLRGDDPYHCYKLRNCSGCYNESHQQC